jgi:TatD DNase family protein
MDLTNDVDTIIMEADNNNVKRMIISGCDKKSIRDGLEIIYRYDEIFMTAGFHPDEADTVTDKDLEDLENVIKTNKKIIGVGEIGLDYYHNDDNRDKQIELFEKQLKLAEKYDLPVVIHSRDSIQEVYDILAKHKNRGVIHCFSGSLEMAREFVKLGFYLGIGGVITFKNSKLKDIFEEITLDNIVLETDSPYLAPTPLRGTVNSSKNIPLIAEELTKIYSVSIAEVSSKTISNTKVIFNI